MTHYLIDGMDIEKRRTFKSFLITILNIKNWGIFNMGIITLINEIIRIKFERYF